jgi:hypothetical protein
LETEVNEIKCVFVGNQIEDNDLALAVETTAMELMGMRGKLTRLVSFNVLLCESECEDY